MRLRSRLYLTLSLVALGSWSLTLAGCAALNRAEAIPEDLARAVPVVDPVSDTAPEPAPTTGELIGPDDPDIQAAMKAWKANGQAPIIRKDEFVQYPYGLTEAIVTCQPLRVCDIELEAGEEVLNVSLAWMIRRAVKRCSALAGASPAWGNCRFAPVATETARRITDLSKLSGHRSTMGGSASRRAATRVKPEQASKGKS